MERSGSTISDDLYPELKKVTRYIKGVTNQELFKRCHAEALEA